MTLVSALLMCMPLAHNRFTHKGGPAVPHALQQFAAGPLATLNSTDRLYCVCLQSRLIALCETQEQYFALAARRQEALGMSTYDEATFDCLGSEASERLHSLHEVGDSSPSLHCKHKKQHVATLKPNSKGLFCTLMCKKLLACKPCMWGLRRRGTEPSAGNCAA